MANRLEMAMREAIQRLHALQWSFRRIAEALGIDRETVARHVKCLAASSNAAISITGSEGSNAATFPASPAPPASTTDPINGSDSAAESNAAISITGSVTSVCNDSSAGWGCADPATPGRRSKCEAYRQVIAAKLEQGLSAQRIYQDLVEEHGFQGSYPGVRRFVAKWTRERQLPFRRMESEPGQEAQADFGTGARVVSADGRHRKTHLFRMVLSYSRKAYGEVVYRQTTEDFIRCVENAFWYFGGVPKTLVIDNLKAAVQQADWYDPELTPKLQAFCQHYGLVILPTKPRMPRHKGKTERVVGYAQDNALKGRQFASLEAENEYLREWETNVADQRIHGTTRRQVSQLFAEERPSLQPLPAERFALFHEARRKVHRDGHIEVAKAYYSVPPEYLNRSVWVRWDSRLVRVFNQRFEQIALHVRQEPGRFSTQTPHLAPEKINSQEHGAERLLNQVERIGKQSHLWAQAMLHARGVEGIRVLQGLIQLGRKHPQATLERACEVALKHGVIRLRVLRKILEKQPKTVQRTFGFLDEHPLIRPLDDYARVVRAAGERSAAAPQGLGRHDRAMEIPAERKTSSPDSRSHQGRDGLPPPRPGYPSLGCSPAKPNSVSPNASTVVPTSLPLQENSDDR